jgi:toxin ParE1/3/4
MDAVTANPTRGRPYDDVGAGYRRQKASSHLIFYREVPGAIEVVRVLHEKMDIGSHLPDLS